MLFTIIEVFKNIIKNNSNQALTISILLMFSIRIVSKESSQLFSPVLVFSFISYFLMFTIALEALKKNIPIWEKLLKIKKIFAEIIATNNILNPFLGLVERTIYIKKGIQNVKKM